MYFSLILENAAGDTVDMTTTANSYMVSSVDGLDPPAGSISTSTYAGMNGSYLNNAFIEKRNVVISFAMRGTGIEARRHALYQVVKPTKYIKIYYRTSGIDVYTEGYVETCEVGRFEQLISGQISIICPDIYWYASGKKSATYSRITGAFHFPFPENDFPFPLGVYSDTDNISIENSGDEIGFTIQIEASTGDSVPEVAAVTPTIYNADTGEYLRIQGDVLKGDMITITTKTGEKHITLTRNGVTTNAIQKLVPGSTWLTMREGTSTFHIDAEEGVENLKVTIIHRDAYLGV